VKLIVGLGNPGRKYEATRHNAGFWWVERLAGTFNAPFRREAGFHGDTARLTLPGGEVWLLKPATYMNESGRAVAAFTGFYRIAAEDLLVVHDELDLQPGAVKLKKGGGTSGHNGLNNVAAQLGTKDFWRLRLGIGHPRDNAATEQEVVDYVLHRPGAADRAAIDDAISRSLEVWPLIAVHDMQGAMLRLHTKPVKGDE
jgi:PTH1 family peptidyl-tRNA hydrolase